MGWVDGCGVVWCGVTVQYLIVVVFDRVIVLLLVRGELLGYRLSTVLTNFRPFVFGGCSLIVPPSSSRKYDRSGLFSWWQQPRLHRTFGRLMIWVMSCYELLGVGC
jgi:hypothetical protein